MKILPVWKIAGLLLIGLVATLMAGPRFSDAAQSYALTKMEHLLGVTAQIEDWHIDPVHHALILHHIHLEDTRGPVLSAATVKVHYEGQNDAPVWSPRYRIELIAPRMRLQRGDDGLYRLGTLPLPPENTHSNAFALPRKVSFVDGHVEVFHGNETGDRIAELNNLRGEFERGPSTGQVALNLEWTHASLEHYALAIHRDEASAPLQLGLDLQSAQLATWKDLVPADLLWQPLSGEISGHLKLEMPSEGLAPRQMTLESFKASGIQLLHRTETPIQYTIALLSVRHLSVDPGAHHYRAEGIEIQDLSTPRAHLKRLIAPAYDSELTARVHDIEPILLTGLTYVETQISELILKGLHPRGPDDRFHLDSLIIHGIKGARINSPLIHIESVSFDPHERRLDAEWGKSDELSGVFGIFHDIKGNGIHLTLANDQFSVDELAFGEGHTQSFRTHGGIIEGIVWDRIKHEIQVHHTHVTDAKMDSVTMQSLDAEESRFDALKKQLAIVRLIGKKGEVASNEAGSPSPLKLSEISLHHYHSDALQSHWSAEEVHVDHANMAWLIHPDNQFEIQGLSAGAGKPGAQSDPRNQNKHWTYEIGAIALSHSQAQIKDLGTTPATQFTLKELTLSADDLDSQARDDTDVEAHARIGSRGSVAVKGRLERNPLSGVFRIDLQNFRLPLLAPYWQSISRLSLKRGYANLMGELRIIPGDHHHVEFEGDGHIDEFETRDPVSGRNIIFVKKLTLDDVAISTHPKRFYTRVMDFEEAYLHLVLKADHHLNLSDLFRTQDAVIVPSEIRAMHFDPSPAQEPPHAAIGLVRFYRSRVDYSDLGFKPQLSTSVRELEGTLRGLSSRQDAKAEISLSGKINRNSPVRLSGELEPMDYQDHTDLLLDFTGLNLTSFPQYAGRFSGYRVTRGKLNLDLHYQIDQSVIQIENRAVIDRLTLGERIEEAHHGLVDLALWMLKDNRGNLDIDLPIYGDLENPSYELSTLYAEALVQFFEKLFSTPATLVQDLIPTAHEEQTIAFSAGERAVNPAMMNQLSRIINLFKAQEGGVIEITPNANPKTDGLALADEALRLELKEAYVHDLRLAGKPVISRDEIHLTEKDMKHQFKRYFKEHHPDKMNALPVEGAEDELDPSMFDVAWSQALEAWQTSPDLLLDLAEDRADAIRNRLVREYDIDDGSIYLRQAEFQSEKNPIPIRVEYFSD